MKKQRINTYTIQVKNYLFKTKQNKGKQNKKQLPFTFAFAYVWGKIWLQFCPAAEESTLTSLGQKLNT